ncbi:hypothetical protein ACFSM7_00545, partial [Clavibacter michiganensis subsp. tessellarius]
LRALAPDHRARPSEHLPAFLAELVTSGIDVDIADLAVDPRTTPPEGPLVGRTASIRQDVAAAFGTADAGAVRGTRADARPAASAPADADAGSSAPAPAPGSASAAAAAAAITWEAAVALSPWWDDRGRPLPADDGPRGMRAHRRSRRGGRRRSPRGRRPAGTDRRRARAPSWRRAATRCAGRCSRRTGLPRAAARAPHGRRRRDAGRCGGPRIRRRRRRRDTTARIDPTARRRPPRAPG